MFKRIRIAILLFILFLVGANAYLTKLRVTDWEQSLAVVIYPINADGSSNTQNYVDSLTLDVFKPVEIFLQEEAHSYGIELEDPASLELAPEVNSLPPPPPFGADTFAIIWWSLKLRYWAWKNDTYTGPLVNIQIFVLYYNPQAYKQLDHSLGLEEGHICMVKAFATRLEAARNNVIIAHEMLHTLGATDKYDLQTLQPVYPEGYAEPEKTPLLPQDFAEIMGGTIPLSSSEVKMPLSLAFAVVGPETAREIKWIE